MNLDDATKVSGSENRFLATIDPEWCIWGPIGGYIAAIALRSVGLIVAVGHRPVTLTCQFLGRGLPGETEVIVEPLKSGSTSFFNVRLIQNGLTFLQAQICTTSKNDGPMHSDIEMPDVPHPETLESYADQLRRFGYPPISFWENVDGRQVDFRPPGDPDPRGCRTECWLRFEDWVPVTDPFLDAARALILIDTHIWRAYNRGQPQIPKHVAPSLDLSVWFHDSAAESAWQLVEARANFSGHSLLNGYAQVWSDDGKLVASGGGQCLFVPLKRE
jgi:acyl-CoA thioesterase II